MVKFKAFTKIKKNKNSKISSIFKITEYIPIEFLPTNQIVINFLINDRINIIDESTEKFVLNTYFRLFLNREFAESIPAARLEIWLLSFIDLVEKTNSSELSEEAFEKIIKKCLILMLRENYLENLKSFTQKVFKSINLTLKLQ